MIMTDRRQVAAFLDRDKTICRDMGFEESPANLGDPGRTALLPRAAEGIRTLNEAGLLVIVVSNQSPIGHGHYTEVDMERVNDRMYELLHHLGARVDGFRYCPHRKDEECECRKPKPGMLRQAATEHGIDLWRSYMVGDAASDIAAGRTAGCKTVYIGERIDEHGEPPDFPVVGADWMCDDLGEAAEWIIAREGRLR